MDERERVWIEEKKSNLYTILIDSYKKKFNCWYRFHFKISNKIRNRIIVKIILRMATPFAHAHVLHLTRMKRRRSQSVTLPNSNEEDAPGQSIRRVRINSKL
jgi:hypothetical protein